MTRGFGARFKGRGWMAAAVLMLSAGLCAGQQAPAGQNQTPSSQAPSGQSSSDQNPSGKSTQKPKTGQTETRITPEEAKKLFAMVDQLLKFSSDETGLQVKSTVGRKLTSRAEVESYLKEKFNEDDGAKRLQRGEIVLKKFGLLDHDFDMKPFLLALLTEQIEAYYDSKTKTVYLLDWMKPEDQESVLAHELTHALQDQRVNLEKWNDQTPNDVSLNAHEDTDHLAKDEIDTAREAVAEGQATAVMVDDELKPHGRSLLKDPEVVEFLKQQMADPDNSPVMARAPLLLSESLMFPYREGLSFEQDIWMDRGREAAFAGALDKPPSSSWEIINPLEFEKSHVPAVPLLPDIHPLLDGTYTPYDIGQVGQLDLHILTQLFGGDEAAKNLTPAWDGGIYWAGQLKSAKTPEQMASTKSIALFYLSAWKNEESAEAFTQLYANALGRKYSGLKKDVSATPADLPGGTEELVYSTNEGPVVITTRGKLVFVAESFELPVARKLTAMILDMQGTGEMRMAQGARPAGVLDGASDGAQAGQPVGGSTLSGGLVHLFAESGAMKAAVQAARNAAQMAQ
ncbi:ImmA/IrrE family metallo-endopeptidase [Terracidiphilus sp.]|uniref:ImmA/IrrE family metallo-endopeptidase n=1 Tax=Terracidiphilus sp. TaxID=1964191 RepID=UPI003C21A813